MTIGISGLCSILEAMILSSTTAEIEVLKEQSPNKGEMLERFRSEIEETSSAILSLNTIANTLGATLVGGLAQDIFNSNKHSLLYFAIGLTIGILLFAEIIPKNIGVLYPSVSTRTQHPTLEGLTAVKESLTACKVPWRTHAAGGS